MKIKTALELAKAAEIVARNYKTLYVLGCFGAPMNGTNKKRYKNNNDFNKSRSHMIDNATADTFGFDCVCLIKALLWDWNGDSSKQYGGSKYASNGVPDIGADTMLDVCSEISTDFSHIAIGEAVGMDGHIGIYIGNGLAVECTPKWENKVQITAVGNIGKKKGYNTRTWERHGKLPYVSYETKESEEKELTEKEVKALIDKAIEANKEKVYHYWSELPEYAVKPIKALYEKGIFSPSPKDLSLNKTKMQCLVNLARAMQIMGQLKY